MDTKQYNPSPHGNGGPLPHAARAGGGDGNLAPPPKPHHEEHALEEIPKDLPRVGGVTITVIGVVILALGVGFFLLGYLPHRARVKQAEEDKNKITDARPAVGITHPTRPKTSGELLLPGD